MNSITTTASKFSPFANKKDLEAAEKRIKELEKENRALKAGTASTAPATKSPAATWTPKPTPTLTRAGFNALTAQQKTEFFSEGGKLINQ